MKCIQLIALIFASLFIGCTTIEEQHKPIDKIFDKTVSIPDSLINKTDWYFKDIIDDSIPGISLEKAQNSILKNKKGSEVIVAVIDGRFDINHPALKDYLWINPEETLNYLDDDNNGYVDDLYGWNFMGNSNGESAIAANQEYVRIVRLFKEPFKNTSIETVPEKDRERFQLYTQAKLKFESELEEEQNILERSNQIHGSYINAREALKYWFPTYNYNLETLRTIDTLNNDLGPYVREIQEVIAWKESDKLINYLNKKSKLRYNYTLNINFNDRELVGDNPYDMNDTIYGNNQIFAESNYFDHGTRVSSVITSVFNGSKNFKILPISKSPSGDYYDKDLALAIRYAVNKGVKVVNMSFGKSFSLNNKWVLDAFKYAEENNILLIGAAGNSSENIDLEERFPTDNNKDGEEVVDNFIKVGASGYTVDENLRAYFSSYGIKDVDLFAPGYHMKTALPNHNNYNDLQYLEDDAGTSLSAAITSGVAALIFSHYPDLTASQVKKILMDSGITYTFPVKVPTEEDENHTIPFNELSKSGKILNVYNALIMAEEMSNIKK